MKRSVGILSVFLILLLSAMGLITAGALRQSRWLEDRARQVAELTEQLNRQQVAHQALMERADEAERTQAALTVQRDEAVGQLRDALLVLEELRAAAAIQAAQREAEQAALAEERDSWRQRLDQAERAARELAALADRHANEALAWEQQARESQQQAREAMAAQTVDQAGE